MTLLPARSCEPAHTRGTGGPVPARPEDTNAFGPTDTLPLTGRAKLAMQTEALVSFTILTLALGRVVNGFA